MSRTRCSIWWDTAIQAYRISVPFNSKFVDAIKALVPASDRAFDPSTKIWTFTERFLSPIQNLAETVWSKPEVTVITREASERALGSTAQKGTLDTAILSFFKLLTFDAANKAYRAAAMELHPDRGGDMSKMSQLNAAWERIQREHYGKKS